MDEGRALLAKVHESGVVTLWGKAGWGHSRKGETGTLSWLPL